ncbi:MAG: response regulator [Bacteriovoracaceae bacterium]|nr:response regulator [Bacteriovoracaceae bacterium]
MKKILLIEDDTVMRENTAEILELAGFSVKTAVNGKNGCALAKEVKPDLIVCDIMMPELDGYGVLHVLSRDPKTASIPFIFLTAKAEKSEVRKGMELGADDYLTKPFEDTDLLNAIEMRLKKVDALKQEFSRDAKGVNRFLDEASGLQELQSLSKGRESSKYKKKEIIFHMGDTPHYLYFLVKGSVKVFKTHDDGKDLITNIYQSGEFFGHVSLFENHLYSDTALVMEDSEILKIPKEDFLALIYKNRDVAQKFIQLLSNQVEEQEKQLLRLAYDTVRKRTAEALLQLMKLAKAKNPNSVRISRDDLANMVGTATETVIRCLAEFKEDEMVEIHGREITVLDRAGLESIP